MATIEIPKITLDEMRINGDLSIMTGYYTGGSTIPHTEYVFSSKVTPSILIRLKL